MTAGRAFTQGHFALSFNGSHAAYVKSFELGKMVGEVSTNNAGPLVRQKKQVTKFKFEPCSFEFGLSHSNEILQWISSSFDLNHTMKDMQLTIFDMRMKPQRTVEFFTCHLTEFKLAKFDAKSAKDGLYATVKFQCEDMKFAEGGQTATAMVGTKQKKHQGTNYEFTVPGINTQHVHSVEVPGYTCKLAEHAVGLHNRSTYEPASFEFGDLKFTISAHEADKLHQTAVKWLADGKRSEEEEVTAHLAVKGPDGQTNTVDFEFLNCGYKSVSVMNKNTANEEQIASSTVEMYCEQVKMKILEANM